jgi:allantoinase
MSHYDLIVRGGQVVGTDGVSTADVAIKDGVIVEVAPEIAGPSRDGVEAQGLHVLPGAVDIHVHFNEPGRTEWEGWATGSAACAAGGTTAVAEMPLNAHPPTLDGASFDAKRRAAEASSLVDFALWGGLTPLNLDRMEELAERGAVGFKAFMCESGIADFPFADDATLYEGMQRAAALGLPVAVHAENESITKALAERARQYGRVEFRDFLESRPPIAEIEAISRALHVAAETGCALHVVHVSTARGLALIAEGRAQGVDVTAETCPHYLLFSDVDGKALGALAKCAPPLRPREECERLWRALERGEVQVVASDHSPSPPELKAGDDFFQIWGGISGCQSLVPATLSAGHDERGLPLPFIMNLLSAAPARRLRLAGKGLIAPGYDADLMFVDLASRVTLQERQLRYRHQMSPFVNRSYRAVVRRTMLRGMTIVLDGEIVGKASGRLLTPASTNQ